MTPIFPDRQPAEVEQGSLFPDRPLDEAVESAHEIVARAKEDHRPTKTFALFSGGNDSIVVLDALAQHADAIVHANTGIGVPEAHEFARMVAARYDLPYFEMTPPESYESLVMNLPVLDGLPGPGVHHIMVARLKERCFEEIIRRHRTFHGERFMLLSGIRRAESKRRAKTPDPVDRKGGQVWVKPLLDWSNREMNDYRTDRGLPRNPVSDNLGVSGECLCGAMTDGGEKQEERAMIRFFYPAFDARLCSIEKACRDAGKTYCEWGTKRIEPEPEGFESSVCAACAPLPLDWEVPA